MKMFVLFLFLCFFVVGCQAEDEVAFDENIVEEAIEETLEAPLELLRDLFGKTPAEVIETLVVEEFERHNSIRIQNEVNRQLGINQQN